MQPPVRDSFLPGTVPLWGCPFQRCHRFLLLWFQNDIITEDGKTDANKAGNQFIESTVFGLEHLVVIEFERIIPQIHENLFAETLRVVQIRFTYEIRAEAVVLITEIVFAEFYNFLIDRFGKRTPGDTPGTDLMIGVLARIILFSIILIVQRRLKAVSRAKTFWSDVFIVESIKRFPRCF